MVFRAKELKSQAPHLVLPVPRLDALPHRVGREAQQARRTRVAPHEEVSVRGGAEQHIEAVLQGDHGAPVAVEALHAGDADARVL